MQTAQGLPGDLLPGERLFKPAMHLMAHVLAIAQAILNEWNFIAGQEVEIATSLAGNFFYLCAVRAHVAAMPEHGRKGIRVAHENPVGLACRFVLESSLFPGNVDELFTPPGWIVPGQLTLCVFTSEFLDPNTLELLRQSLGQRCGPGGLCP